MGEWKEMMENIESKNEEIKSSVPKEMQIAERDINS